MSGFTLDLNAPYGARCFLTCTPAACTRPRPTGLNAPYGARCFLTGEQYREFPIWRVLMHLMALGAF